ncbi:MAG: RIP metalloprotease RseP [Bacteroidales bacterium]|nr:RIP metalloprotease RseP [Bacteroidales bacterium]
MKVLALILSLTLLIFTHELGHFLFARLFKTRVNRFYLFFNPVFSIIKAKKFKGKWHFLFFNAKTPEEWETDNLPEEDKDNTLWGLGWIPLGGYCDIAGMIDETKKKDDLPKEPQPYEYRSKKPWQRLCIISGGVLVNFISALLIYTCIFAHWGKDDLPLRNATLGYDYHEILIGEGFQNGDIIYYIDGEEMTDLVKTQHKLLLDNPNIVTVMRTVTISDTTETGDSIEVAMRDTSVLVDIAISENLLTKFNPRDTNMLMTVRSPFVVKDFAPGSQARKGGMEPGDSVVSINGEKMNCFSEIAVTLKEHSDDTVTIGFYRNGTLQEARVAVNSGGKIGVFLLEPVKIFKSTHTDYTFLEAIPAGISYGWEQLTSYASSLKILFTPDGYKGLGGFGTLGGLFPETWNWYAFWNITAFLAVILAFMNVIPIPGLDGGHILFTLWEMVTRRKPSDNFLNVAQSIGMILLIALLIIANGNDIIHLLE